MKTPRYSLVEIADRFEEAAATLRCLPPVMVRGYFSAWPPIVRSVMEQLQAEKLPIRLGSPTPAALSRMEETLNWIFLLDSEDERRIIWMRAERIRWKVICCRLGMGKTKARERWTMALLKIQAKLC